MAGIGPCRTWALALPVSAFDIKQTWARRVCCDSAEAKASHLNLADDELRFKFDHWSHLPCGRWCDYPRIYDIGTGRGGRNDHRWFGSRPGVCRQRCLRAHVRLICRAHARLVRRAHARLVRRTHARHGLIQCILGKSSRSRYNCNQGGDSQLSHSHVGSPFVLKGQRDGLRPVPSGSINAINGSVSREARRRHFGTIVTKFTKVSSRRLMRRCTVE